MEPAVKKVEAVLFAVGKEITSERLASLCSLSVEDADTLVSALAEQYQHQDNSLQIVKKDNGWKLTVKDEFVPLVSTLVSSTELERPLMETLAVIAWKYPIVQSEVVKLRNQSAYEHMKQLEERGFIAKEKLGRTFKVKLTGKFFEYFDLPSEEAKQAFLKNVPPAVLQDAEDTDKEADEVERLLELEKQEREGKNELRKVMDDVKN